MTKSKNTLATVLAALCMTVCARAEPLPLCYGVIESGMAVYAPGPLGEMTSGIIIEGYVDEGTSGRAPRRTHKPPEVLEGFSGTRIIHCASGRFFTVPVENYFEVSDPLTNSRFLDRKIQTGQRPSFQDVKRAVNASFPGAMEFRETAETCGCNAMFAELRPQGLTPFAERTDVDR